MKMPRASAAFIACAVWLTACSDTTSPGGNGLATVSFTSRNQAGQTPTTTSSNASPAADTVQAGGDELIITRAAVVLREIELKQVENANCDSSSSSDDCEEFEAGPMLVDLPLSASTEQAISVDIPAGSYREVEFQVHKVSSDDAEDAEFRTAHPDFIGKSIRVEGTFNGQPFVYETDLEAEQEFALSPPLVVGDGAGATNLTIRITVGDWFRQGGGLVDPATAGPGGVNAGLVRENIKQSINAFEDHDRDGGESHDGDE